MSVTLCHGDALDMFRDVCGLNSIVADPPGGGSFMGLAFDGSRGGRDKWVAYFAERFRVAREATERGSWGLFWSFPRTAHWTAMALDDAGWEIVSSVEHVHSQGWPKAKSQLKPAKEIWWLARWGGVTPLQVDRCRVKRSGGVRSAGTIRDKRNPARPTSAGEGDYEIVPAPEPHEGGSWPPDLVLTHAPACREVGVRKVRGSAPASGPTLTGSSAPRTRGRFNGVAATPSYGEEQTLPAWSCLAACTCGLASLSPAGGAPERCPGCGEERWWACPVAELDGQSGTLTSGAMPAGTKRNKQSRIYMGDQPDLACLRDTFADSGGASRFFPCFHYDAKASRAERQAGCEGLLWVRDKGAPIGWRRVSAAEHAASPEKDRAEGNVHATIKPIGCGVDDGFMRWAVRLITPIGGRVGDPFLGSGSTAVAAQIEGHDFVGCDIDAGAVDIARARVAFWTPEMHARVLRDAETLRAATRIEILDAKPLRQISLF